MSVNTVPINFDPATHPILSQHWFGIEPLHPFERKFNTYIEIEPEVIEAADRDEFWQPPLHGVER